MPSAYAPHLSPATLQQRLGGVVTNGGREWRGAGPDHSRSDNSLHVTFQGDGWVLCHSFAGDDDAAVEAHLGVEFWSPERRNRPHSLRPKIKSAERRPTAPEVDRRAFCSEIWAEAIPVQGTVAERYLRGRAVVGVIPSVLRFHPAAPLGYQDFKRTPALIALVQDVTGSPVGLHLTALKSDGSGKSPLGRRIFGKVAGAAVRLGIVADGCLVVTEGVETALSFRDLTGARVWACLSSSGVAAFDLPPSVIDLTIAADGDEAGLAATHKLAERIRPTCTPHILSAPPGMDWNDVLEAAA